MHLLGEKCREKPENDSAAPGITTSSSALNVVVIVALTSTQYWERTRLQHMSFQPRKECSKRGYMCVKQWGNVSQMTAHCCLLAG